MSLPILEHHCGSWVVVCRGTGKAVAEFFTERLASAVNQERYEVITTARWLGRVNTSLKTK